jgi:hypothetical protein
MQPTHANKKKNPGRQQLTKFTSQFTQSQVNPKLQTPKISQKKLNSNLACPKKRERERETPNSTINYLTKNKIKQSKIKV